MFLFLFLDAEGCFISISFDCMRLLLYLFVSRSCHLMCIPVYTCGFMCVSVRDFSLRLRFRLSNHPALQSICG